MLRSGKTDRTQTERFPVSTETKQTLDTPPNEKSSVLPKKRSRLELPCEA
jgi:hypothetical protein